MSKINQKWEIGDCLKLLPEIKTGSVDMILTDLPYGTTACSWDVIIPFELLWEQYERIIRDNGVIVLSATQPFTTELINSNREIFKYIWTWVKSNNTGFLNAKHSPLKCIEDIIIFYKKQPTYNPQYQRVKKKYIKRGHKVDVYNTTRTSGSNNGVAYPTNVLYFNSDRGDHPTQKPVDLFKYLIKTYTNEGDTVHDSCLGSGTTLEACRLTNRNCIGFEISDEWEHLYPKRCMAHMPALSTNYI